MAIIGAHMLLYTSEPAALRGVMRDVFGWNHVDVGDGWLIFQLPPAEIAAHPAEGPTFDTGARHQITLMCDDINKTRRELQSKPGVDVQGEPKDEGWGITCMLGLPGGVSVMLYEPRHAKAIDLKPAGKSKAAPARAKRKTAKAAKPKPRPKPAKGKAKKRR